MENVKKKTFQFHMQIVLPTLLSRDQVNPPNNNAANAGVVSASPMSKSNSLSSLHNSMIGASITDAVSSSKDESPPSSTLHQGSRSNSSRNTNTLPGTAVSSGLVNNAISPPSQGEPSYTTC